MSSRRRATSEAFIDSFLTGDLPAALRCLHPDVTLDEAASLPFGGEFKGHDGFARFAQRAAETIEFDVHGHAAIDAGDQVVVRLHATMRPRGGGPSVPMRVIEVHSFTDGLISGIDVFYKDTDALTCALEAVAR